MIHPTAIIDADAVLGQNVKIGPYCVVGPGVVLGDDVVLKSHVVIRGQATSAAAFRSTSSPQWVKTRRPSPMRVRTRYLR